ncbi:uncharacterized protein LOC113208302 isoform X2 [Frankliniella occidentalis]|uniref:Uncharacterized protein LOC113208302 isoform X2 n=2 Tax=Frankliniella occidentalis TaxID=133901 RepID=A0A9C6U860_FRAOC|nr:uncharacterized protein LOC113208302 isoform X2 [Frankliniella occidentalis]
MGMDEIVPQLVLGTAQGPIHPDKRHFKFPNNPSIFFNPNRPKHHQPRTPEPGRRQRRKGKGCVKLQLHVVHSSEVIMETEKRIELRIHKLEVGDFVFAKLKGYPPWPAKIDQIESVITGGKEKKRYNIYFFGTHQTSNLRESALFPYDHPNSPQIVEKWGKKLKFHDALKELEREMMDKVQYIYQLKNTPETPWCNGFSNACEDLVNEINVDKKKTTSKNHKKASLVEIDNCMEEEIVDESRRLGYEVMWVERIPFPDTPESLIVLSLSYNKDWVKEEIERIKEEERMANCYVKIEPFPPQYAHLDPDNANRHAFKNEVLNEPSYKKETQQPPGKSFTTDTLKPAVPKVEVISPGKISNDVYQDLSSDEEIIETCPVCRLSFFSLADLRDHEKTVHGSVSTADSLFDRLIS